VPADIPDLIELSIEALEIDAYPELLISREKVARQVTASVSSGKHFACVSERDGKVVGGLIAIVDDMLTYERSQATICMWYCRAKGDGLKLMDRFMVWAAGRPMIKQIQYTGERGGDPRILEYLRKRHEFVSDVPFLYKMR
jgi:hypothetical protein